MRATHRLVAANDRAGEVVHHFLPCCFLDGRLQRPDLFHSVEPVAGHAINRLHADLEIAGLLDQLQKGIATQRVGHVADIECIEIILQVFIHRACFEKRVQGRLMEVSQQMFHVQRLHVSIGQQLHVFDQPLFAANGVMAFTDDQASGMLENFLDDLFGTGVRIEGRNRRAPG
ncbi:hypothetical protein D3C71_1580650 [compost metagenome]